MEKNAHVLRNIIPIQGLRAREIWSFTPSTCHKITQDSNNNSGASSYPHIWPVSTKKPSGRCVFIVHTMVGQSLSKNCIKPWQKISKNIKHRYELALSCGFLDDCRVWFCPGLQQALIDLTRESDTGYSSNARLGSKKDQQVFFPKNHQRSMCHHPPVSSRTIDITSASQSP